MKRLRVVLEIRAEYDVTREQMVTFALDLGGHVAPPKMKGKTLHVHVATIDFLNLEKD